MHDQRSPEWFSDKLGLLTGSRAPALAGTADRRRTLAYELTGELLVREQLSTFSNRHTERGLEDEDGSIARYELQTGNDVTQYGLIVSQTNPLFGYSPDGLVNDDGIVEVKSRIPAQHIRAIDQGVPKDAVAQVQWGMYVCDRAWADYVSFCRELPPFAQLLIVRLERDDETIAKLEKAARQVAKHVNELLDRLGVEL